MTKAPIGLPAAAFEKKLALVKAALAAGTDVDTQDGNGRTALHYAAMRDQPELFELLVKHGARVDIPDGFNKLPLHFAAEQGVDKLLARLIELGPSTLDHHGVCGLTALHEAADHKHDRCVELLLAAGASPTIKDNFQRLPIEYATKARLRKLFEGPNAKPTPARVKVASDPEPASPPKITGVAAPLASIDAWKKASQAKRNALGNALAAKLGRDWSLAKATSGSHALLVLEHGPSAMRLVAVPGGGTVLGLRPSDLRVLPKLDLDDELEDSVRASVAPVAISVAPFLCAQVPLLGGQLAALGIKAQKSGGDTVVMFSAKQMAAATKAAARTKLRALTHIEWEWIARSLGTDVFIGASTVTQVEAACDVLSDGVFDAASRRYAAKPTGIWGMQLGEWVSAKPGATPTLGTADIAQTYPWQNEHEVAAAFAGMRPEKPAAGLALRLVCALPRL